MKIRKYIEKDEEKVKKVICDSLINIYGKADVYWEDFRIYEMIFIAENKEKIVGCAMIKRIDSKWAKLKRMYVLPKIQRTGVGQKLLNQCLEFCKSKNYSKLVLTTYPEMKDAVRFYEKNGFSIVNNPCDKFYTNPKLKEYNKRQVVMEKQL